MVLHRSSRVRNVAVIVAALVLAGASSAEPAPERAAIPAGGLAIASDPDGAAVYLDSRLAGATPMDVAAVTAGEHRVRLVKSGYLENVRIVTVAAGKSTDVRVKMTRTSDTAGQVVSKGGGGGGLFSNKWLWIAAAGGGGAAAYLVATKNAAPAPGTISAPAIALMATSVAFSSQNASDPDGDALTYAWNFGDGGTATGSATTHTYASAGVFTVTLTVSDGKHQIAAPTATVTVKSLSATWRGPLSGTTTFNTVVVLTQSGTSLTGTYSDQTGTATVSGSIDGSNGRVTFTCTQAGFAPWTFAGTTGTDINTMTGVANGSGFVNASWSLTRS